MKITAIQTSNFLGARAVDVKLTTPVALFAGKNGAGKSSLQEAVRMALTGESVRVGLKKDYGALVTEGHDSGFVEIDTEEWKFSAVLPAGKGMHSDFPALPYVLDAQRFARLDPNERRAFLFGLMGLKTDGPAVRERLLAKGCAPAKVELIAPFLRAGFEAAQKEAQGKARECKASWKTVTGGETYGSNKAATWRAPKPESKTAELEQARADLAAVDAELEAETTRLGELQGRAKQRAAQQAKLEGLRQQAGMYARVADKLQRDEESLKELEAKVEETRARAWMKPALNTAPHPCPHCGGMLLIHEGRVVEWHEETLPHYDAEAAAQLPEYERAVRLMQSAIANGKRDLAAADTAARTLAQLEGETEEQGGEATDLGALEQRIAAIKHHRGNHQAAIRLMEEAERRAAEADEKTAKAAALHQDVQAWEAIADALAPDGIPGEMLAEVLEPINERLAKSADVAEWPRIEIMPDMTIRTGLTERLRHCRLGLRLDQDDHVPPAAGATQLGALPTGRQRRLDQGLQWPA